MRYLSVGEVLRIYRGVMQQTGGLIGIRDVGALESAVAQPRMSFAGQDLYPSIAEKAAALGFSLIQNHPFSDGNKRTGHAAMELFLLRNGYEIDSSIKTQFETILSVASGTMDRAAFARWVESNIVSAK